MATRHIVALGGGGFSDQVPFSLLDDYILGLARQSPARVCFLPTASGDPDAYVASFYRAYAPRPCRPIDLRLFARTIVDLRAFLLEQDVIYVGGGNTANMLAVWRTHEIDVVLREAWERGIVLAGVSAGAICWFEAGVTDSFGPALSGLRDGLGLLSGSACPHYNSEARRRPVYGELVRSGFPSGFAIDDNVALHFVDRELAEVVSDVEGRSAYAVTPDGSAVQERPLTPRILR